MADSMTPEQRHRCMAAVKGKNTKPEMIVRRYLHSLGFRYGLHNRKLPGCPDLVLRKYKTVIFIHGCFWHGHEGCKYNRVPKSNIQFWANKISRNKHRDICNKELLSKLGWNVLTVWECDLKTKKKRDDTLTSLTHQLNNIKYNNYCFPENEENTLAAEEESHYGK